MPVVHLLDFLNTSPFVSGCLMLMINIGGKYIIMDVPKGMNSFFTHPWVRKLILLSISFAATRNIKTALIISLIFIICSRYLMNENSKLCIPFIKKHHEENKHINI